MLSMESIFTLIGLLLSLMIFSYLIGDNPLFRIAMYLFVGVASGYAAAVIVRTVLWPRLNLFQTNDINQLILIVIPILLSITILTKFSARISWFGNFAMAILVGVGAAAAIGGSLIGTLLPQAEASMNAFSPRLAPAGTNYFSWLLQGAIMLVGTVFTLASFHFTASRAADGTVKRISIFEGLAAVGRIFIAITFGVLFAGVYMAALTAMIERLSSFINFTRQIFGL